MVPTNNRLPVFPLKTFELTDHLTILFGGLFGFQDSDAQRFEDYVIFTAGNRMLDINRHTGEVWMADEDRLWKPRFDVRHAAVSQASSRVVAERWLHGVLQKTEIPIFAPFGIESQPVCSAEFNTRAFRVQVPPGSPTSRKPQSRTRLDMDRHFCLTTQLKVPDPQSRSDEHVWAPLVGRGVRYGVTFDLSGNVIGFHGALPQTSEPAIWSPAIDMETSLEAFRRRFAAFGLRSKIRSSLAYELCDTRRGPYLRPVWLHRALPRVADVVLTCPW